jgi:hypothetical protein
MPAGEGIVEGPSSFAGAEVRSLAPRAGRGWGLTARSVLVEVAPHPDLLRASFARLGPARGEKESNTPENYLGKFVDPIKNRSIARAHKRPSRIAQTTSDWPRRMSPAENTFGREV